MKRIFPFLIALAAVACTTDNRFHITGNIHTDADTTLYLEQITLGDGIVCIDSARLSGNGAFSLSGKATPTPEFYRLRIGTQFINLAVDSTETISIEANAKQLASSYSVKGSGSCDTIRILCAKLAMLEKDIRNTMQNNALTIEQRSNAIDTLIKHYKDDVKLNFMRHRYEATSSYFACFQRLGGAAIFNPLEDKSDLTWLRAVANAWHDRYPGQPRTENLANIVAQARQNQAKPREIVLDLDNSKVRELGIIDITLPDINGVDRTLSDLKGQVVLLDFTKLDMEGSQARTILLRELYDKYHSQGLEIYQVSLDESRNLWAQRCENLPWISVYCEDASTSAAVHLYQVSTLPYYFLIDRNADLQARMENINDLEKAIETLIKN